MKIENLNRIKTFADKPSALEFTAITSRFDSLVEEEFFWSSIAGKNQVEIFEMICSLNQTLITNRLSDLQNETNYNSVHFRIFRFLINVSHVKGNSESTFKELNKIVVFSIGTLTINGKFGHHQAMYFTSELILHLPVDYITSVHIDFLRNFALGKSSSYVGADIVHKFVPNIVERKDAKLLLIVLDELVFSIKPDDYKNGRLKINYDGYNVSNLLEIEQVKAISELIGSETLFDFAKSKIELIADQVPYNFSHFNIPTVEDSNQILNKDTYEYILVKFLRIIIEVNEIKSEKILDLVNSKQPILQRLGVYAFNKHYSTLKDLFWSIASTKFFTNFEIKHETFMLLKENGNVISKANFNTFLEVLDRTMSATKEEIDSRDFSIVWAKEYLMAFKDCNSEIRPLFDEKMAELDKLNPVKIQHPGYNVYFERGVSVDKDREEGVKEYTAQDLPNLLELVKNGFPEKNQLESLKVVNATNFVFRNNVDSILANQGILLEIGVDNFSEIPSFYEKAWLADQKIDWTEVFDFFGRIIDSNYYKNPEAYQQFIGYCSWLIRSICRDDTRKLSSADLISIKNLCLKFLNLYIKNERLNNDPFFDILNSTDGKIFDATLNLLLRNARDNKAKDDSDKWFSDVKQVYSDILNRGDQTDAFIWSISMYLPQFGYLDMNWVKLHFNKIFPQEKHELWLLAMRVYHKYCSNVYQVIYEELLKGGHYDNALKYFIGEQQGIDDVFGHVVMAYVCDWEGSQIEDTDSIINKVLKIGDRSQIYGLIYFFIVSKHFTPVKLFSIWKAILESDIRDKEVYNDLLSLTESLKAMDEESFELIQTTLKNITTSQILHRLVHSILSDDMKDVDPIYKAKILLEIKEPDFLVFFDSSSGFENLTKSVIKKDLDFGRHFARTMIEKKLFGLLDIYNNSEQIYRTQT